MTVHWTKLTLVEARGFIQNYTVAYYPSSESRKRQQSIIKYKIVDNDTHRTTVDGLDVNFAYVVQVSVNTGAGSGPLSLPVLVQRHGENLHSFIVSIALK